MAKKKQFLHPKKDSGKRKPAAPETENEFLEAGVDHEEAGEKWRAGDAAKSLRFFLRAIATYDGGLQIFPEAFDLAYNKARLQYEVAQQPRLLAHLPTPLNELLQVALDSHRYAVKIDQDNIDLLFNMAQVLTSLAEAITEGKRSSDQSRSQALKLLQESLEFSQRCLNVQEYQLNQAQEFEATDNEAEQSTAVMDGRESRGTKTPTSSSDQVKEETWATIIEPVTPSSLLDTIVAQIETLATICVLESSPGWPLAWVEEYYQASLQQKLAAFASTTQRENEASLVEAKFRCALADAAFRNSRIDLPTYLRELQESFEGLDMSNSPQGLCDRADAELALYASMRQGSLSDQDNLAEMNDFNKTCWKHISTALDSLTAASKLPGVQNLARIHLRRGDCELLRLSLGEQPTGYDRAIKSASVILGNASLYYRMAGRQASQEGAEAKEEGKESYVKELIVSMLADKREDFKGISSNLTRVDIQEMAAEMQEEGILGQEGAAKVVGYIS